jgi:hypothetical protein
VGRDRFGDLQRGAAVGLGQAQGDGAGEIAAGRIGRALDRDRRVVRFGGLGEFGPGLLPGSLDGQAHLVA